MNSVEKETIERFEKREISFPRPRLLIYNPMQGDTVLVDDEQPEFYELYSMSSDVIWKTTSLDEGDLEVDPTSDTGSGSESDQPHLEVLIEEKEELPHKLRSKNSVDEVPKSKVTFGSNRSQEYYSDESPRMKGEFMKGSPTHGSKTPPILRAYSNTLEQTGFAQSKIDQDLYLSVLHKGCRVRKYSTTGKTGKRWLQLSQDGSVLQWSRTRLGGLTRSLDLGSVVYMSYGPRTKSFIHYDWAGGTPWLCLSLITSEIGDRHVNFEFLSRVDLLNWYQGLCYFIPLNYRNLSFPKLRWYMAVFKTVRIAHQLRFPVRYIWHALVRAAMVELYPDQPHDSFPLAIKCPCEDGEEQHNDIFHNFNEVLQELQAEPKKKVSPKAAKP